MGLVFEILLFIGYLAFLAGMFWLYNESSKRDSRDARAGESFAAQARQILLFGLLLFGTAAIIARSVDWGLMLFYLVAASLAAIVRGVIGATLGEPNVNWGAQVVAAAGELGATRPRLTQATLIAFALIMFLGLPVAMGIVLFGQDIPSDAATLLTYRIALIILVILPIPTSWATQVWLLANENLDERTRIRMFASGAGSAIYYAFLLSLLFWSFGSTESGVSVDAGIAQLDFSPTLAILLLAYVLGIVVVPHLIGYRRASAWRSALIEQERALASSASESIARAQIAPDSVEEGLEELEAEIQSVADRFLDRWEFLGNMVDEFAADDRDDDQVDEPTAIPNVDEPTAIPNVDEPTAIPNVDEPTETIPNVDELMTRVRDFAEQPWSGVEEPGSTEISLDSLYGSIADSYKLDPRWNHLSNLRALERDVSSFRHRLREAENPEARAGIESDGSSYFEKVRTDLTVADEESQGRKSLVANGAVALVTFVFTQAQGVIGSRITEFVENLL